jgi:hypothetical protein
MIYFIVFGSIMASLISQLFLDGGTNFFASKFFWTIVLGALLLPVVIQKTLATMKWAADLHLMAVALFLICLLIERFISQREYNLDPEYDYWTFNWKLSSVTTFSILLVSYNFSFIEFPLYHSLGSQRTPKKLLDATALALAFTFVIYCSTGLLAVYLFGSGLDTNCLNNIGAMGSENYLSLVVRIAFAVVVACHVPYIFFYGKEACCIITDELINKSTSQQIEKKRSEDEEDLETPPAYLGMNSMIYYGLNLFLYAGVIFGANMTDNLGIIFDYLAAFSVSGMQFLLPGICYLRLASKTDLGSRGNKLLAYFFSVFSVCVSSVIVFNNLYQG